VQAVPLNLVEKALYKYIMIMIRIRIMIMIMIIIPNSHKMSYISGMDQD